MCFLRNREVYFNQESLPITYHNFHHKSLVRPKSISPNWQGSQPINYKVNFSQKESLHLTDVEFSITYQNKQGEIQVRPLLRPDDDNELFLWHAWPTKDV